MKLKPNIGLINALIRITCGFTILSWSTAKIVKRPWRDSYLLLAMMGAMKIAEGIVRYCPVTDLIENLQDRYKEENGGTAGSGPDQEIPYSPS